MTREEKIRRGAKHRIAFYRANPHRFAHDYLHLDLRIFQKILLVMMFISNIFVFIGTRGIGKSFIAAVSCVCRCILYPGTKICIASSTRGQALNILEKIMMELRPRSPELAAEIDEKNTHTNGTQAIISFLNGSYIKVVTASDSSRGNRANVLIIDEFRMVDKDVIDTILKKFLTLKRMPPYRKLTKDERKAAYAKERNMTYYMSSAYWADHWSYDLCETTFENMLDDRRHQFVCGLPYQLSIQEGLLDRTTIEDELADPQLNSIKFSMEYEALFYGASGDEFFDYNSISKNRHIKYPMMPSWIIGKYGNPKQLQIQPKQTGEFRILSADIALMSSKKHGNDATSIWVNSVTPTKAGRYTSNIVYGMNCEGMRTDDQALIIRKLYDEFMCDYIVLDANGEMLRPAA